MLRYYPEIEVCQGEIDMEEDEKRKTCEREKLEDFGTTFLGKLRKKLWDLFEYPHTSRGAQVREKIERDWLQETVQNPEKLYCPWFVLGRL